MRLFVALLAAPLALGCKEEPAPAKATAPSTAVSSVRAPVAASAPAPVARTPKPVPSPIQCKALAKKKLVAIGAHGGRAALPVTANGHVYVFAHEEARARATLLAMPRNGDKAAEIGHVTSTKAPDALVVDEGAAYFTVGRKLMALPLSGGEARELAPKVGKPLALGGGKLYALRCPADQEADELVSVEGESGTTTVVASIPRASKSTKCEYSALTVTDAAAYVSDWSKRRILKLALTGGALTVLAEKQAFPGRIVPGGGVVLFQSSTGVQQVSDAGGAVKTLTGDGAMPFEALAWDESDLYILNTPAYSERDMVVRLPRAGGKREELEHFRVADVTAGGGRVDLTVDEQCVYLAHDSSRFMEILARPK